MVTQQIRSDRVIDAGKVVASSFVIGGATGDLLVIHADGRVEGKIENVSEAGRLFVEHVRGYFTITNETSKKLCAMMDEMRRRAPFGHHELGSPFQSYRDLHLHSNDIGEFLDQVLHAAMLADRASRILENAKEKTE